MKTPSLYGLRTHQGMNERPLPLHPVESWHSRLHWVLRVMQRRALEVQLLPKGSMHRRCIAAALMLLDREIESLGQLIAANVGATLARDSQEVQEIEERLSAVVLATREFENAMRGAVPVRFAA